MAPVEKDDAYYERLPFVIYPHPGSEVNSILGVFRVMTS